MGGNQSSAESFEEHGLPGSVPTELDTAQEQIFGELDVTQSNGAKAAELVYLETTRMLDSTNWTEVYNKQGLTIEKKPTNLNDGSLYVFRARISLPVSVSAKAFFDHITKPENYSIIDPDSNPDNFGKDLARFRYRSEAQIEQAFMKLPMAVFASQRSYLTLGVKDNTTQQWVGKSVKFEAVEGSTKFYEQGKIPCADGTERIFYEWAIRVAQGEDERNAEGGGGGCVFSMVQLIELGGSVPTMVSNGVQIPYFKALAKRLKKCSSEKVMGKDEELKNAAATAAAT